MNKKNIKIAITMLFIGLFVGWIVKPTHTTSSESTHEEQAVTGSEPSVWTCSMDPQVRQVTPGKCPICGMDLIPLESDSADDSPGEIKMSPTAMQLANVQTILVGTGAPVREIRVNGKVQQDERRVFTQSSHLEGRVEQLAINFTGEPIIKGQKIASIYSPALVTAQEELFAARKYKDSQPALYSAAKQKLMNWKLTEEQVELISKSESIQDNFPILSDFSGVVTERKVNLGDYLMRGMPIYEVVDLSKVWVLFDVYESDMLWVKLGSRIDFTVQSLPGQNFNGTISFIDPIIDPMTRVAKARIEIENRGLKLKPEMFTQGLIKARIGSKNKEIIIPKSAVLWTGPRSVVYTKRADEKGVYFSMKEIELGPLVGEGYVIKSGLEDGDEIAVNGTFSIDAAAQLAGKTSMMNPEGNETMSAHDHGAMGLATKTQKIQISQEAKSAIYKGVQIYIELKDALVKAEFNLAQKQIKSLLDNVENTNMTLFTGDAHDTWMQRSEALKSNLQKMMKAGNTEDLRRLFKNLSGTIVAMVKEFGPFDETIYVQHCPMADNNKGGDWISLEEQIRNPYFGNKMLKCGKVTQTIK